MPRDYYRNPLLRARAAAGVPKAALAREFGVSRETVYAYLRAEPATA
ncbi:helix-turn-helix domain-containing protein [Nocardia sp. CY41]|nr:helix-turn-helix domain-containing protein [Nocardia sp. CY41]